MLRRCEDDHSDVSHCRHRSKLAMSHQLLKRNLTVVSCRLERFDSLQNTFLLVILYSGFLSGNCKLNLTGEGTNSPHSSQGHQAPPEGVKEGPGSSRIVLKKTTNSVKIFPFSSDDLLGEVDKRGKREDRDPHQQHEQPQLLVGLARLE